MKSVNKSLWVEGFVLEGKPTGAGQFIGHVLTEWAKHPEMIGIPLDWIRLVLRDSPASRWHPLTQTFPVERIYLRRPSFFIWQQGRVRRRLRAQQVGVYLAPNYTIPLGVPVPRAVVVHDVSFLRRPEWFPLYKRWLWQRLAIRSIKEAGLIFTPSVWTADEIVALTGAPTSKIVVTYEGWNPSLRTPPTLTRADLLQRWGIPEDGFLWLVVGSIFQRRRPELIIRCWQRMVRETLDPPPVLVWIGENRTYPYVDYRRFVRHLGLSRWIHLLDYQPDEVIHAFYHHADGVLYLSEYEGFGLPILEALAVGKPVVVSDIPVFRELFGDAVIRVPLQDDAVMDTLRTVMRTPPSVNATTLLTRYTWAETAQRVGEALRSLWEGKR